MHIQPLFISAPELRIRNLCATVRRLRVIHRWCDVRTCFEFAAVRCSHVALLEDQWADNARRIAVRIEADVGFNSPRGFQIVRWAIRIDLICALPDAVQDCSELCEPDGGCAESCGGDAERVNE